MTQLLGSRLLNLITLFLFYQTTTAELTIKPTDTETLVGQLTYFNCSSSLASKEIQWFHYGVETNAERQIVYGYDKFYTRCQGRCQMDKNTDTGAYNLVIQTVTAEDVGRYECQDDSGTGDKSSANLIVLEEMPVCQSSTNLVTVTNDCEIPPTELRLTCIATFLGTNPPKLDWRKNGSEISLTEGLNFRYSGNMAVYNVTIKGDSVEDGSSYRCQTTRSKTTNANCTSGILRTTGSQTTQCNSQALKDAIFVIVFLLLPLLMVGCFIGGVYLQTRRPLPLFKQKNAAEGNKPAVRRAAEKELHAQYSGTNTKDCQEMNTLIKKQDYTTDDMKEMLQNLTHDNKKLQNDKLKLEEQLYPSKVANYAEKMDLIHTLNTKAAEKAKGNLSICGMAILSKELFVANEGSPVLEVYDSITFKWQRDLEPPTIVNPVDLASCTTMERLYIYDQKSGNEDKEILTIASDGTVKNRWPIGKDSGQLSVTREGNVIVCLFEENKIIEFSPDGDEIQIVRLSPAFKVKHPWHAVKTTSIHYLFSHGTGKDSVQRVCVANVRGEVVASFGKEKGSDIEKQHMNRPIYFVEDRARNILVADLKNGLIFLLSSTLEFKRKLVEKIKLVSKTEIKRKLLSTKSDGLRHPVRLCLDEEHGRLFVADNEYDESKHKCTDGRVLIYNIRPK